MTIMTSRPKILLLGDSLTQLGWDGWVGLLAHRYQRRADILNRGNGGYNTRWYLKYAETSGIWSIEDVTLVTIFFGANDAADKELNPRQHVPILEYKENLQKLIGLCKESFGQDVPILIITPPPVVHEQRLAYQIQRYKEKATGKLERTMNLSKQYADAAAEIAREAGLPLVHLWKVLQQESGWESFFYDGLHFTAAGNKFVGKSVLNAIEDAYPVLKVTLCPYTSQSASSGAKCEKLKGDGPWHDEIDFMNYEEAFKK